MAGVGTRVCLPLAARDGVHHRLQAVAERRARVTGGGEATRHGEPPFQRDAERRALHRQGRAGIRAPGRAGRRKAAGQARDQVGAEGDGVLHGVEQAAGPRPDGEAAGKEVQGPAQKLGVVGGFGQDQGRGLRRQVGRLGLGPIQPCLYLGGGPGARRSGLHHPIWSLDLANGGLEGAQGGDSGLKAHDALRDV